MRDTSSKKLEPGRSAVLFVGLRRENARLTKVPNPSGRIHFDAP